MKITFILPAIGKKKNQKYIKTWQQMEPLTFALLKAITPKDIETEFFDDRIELIDYNTKTDIVAISVEIYTAKRAYIIADKFRKKNIKIVLGGWHVTLNPDEAKLHADSIVLGNAEEIWEKLIENYKQNNLKKIYYGRPIYKHVIPDRSIFKNKTYSKLAVVETGRGCNYICDFCAVTSFYKHKYYQKPVNDIVNDIIEAKKSGKKLFFFADDNIVANQNKAIELFKKITPLKIIWTGQGSLTMAKNTELLYWMKKSGCKMILIGYESLDKRNLDLMNKSWNAELGEVEKLTKKIHQFGISIYATFVFGMDFDDKNLFIKTVKFAKKAGFFTAAFNHLLPIPGTSFFNKLAEKNKLIHKKWWLQDNSLYGKISFKPKLLSPEELSKECKTARKKFHSIFSIIKRSILTLIRSKSIIMFIYFWIINLNLSKEVDGKYGIPIGDNLDELPK